MICKLKSPITGNIFCVVDEDSPKEAWIKYFPCREIIDEIFVMHKGIRRDELISELCKYIRFWERMSK